MEGYIIRFIRADRQPDELYYYHLLADARNHFDLFHDDDSGLYTRIELIKLSAKRSILDYIVL